MDRTTDIIKKINSISGSKSPYNVFTDWIKCTALAIMQSVWFLEEREKMYLNTIKDYNGKDFSDMCAWLSETIEYKMTDVLGNLFMQSGWENKNTGQFFTPYNVSLMTAKMTITDIPEDKEYITLNEPSAGAGGMVIAAAEVIKDSGRNYQKCLRVVAQDLDWNAFYMCYIQLSLYGIDAKVVQGDTLLCKPFKNLDSNVFLTPMFMLNGASW